MMHAEGAVHVTTERSVLAATVMALDHVPAGPVVVVVVGAVAWDVVVVGDAALIALVIAASGRQE